jgi:hypothetical protein
MKIFMFFLIASFSCLPSCSRSGFGVFYDEPNDGGVMVEDGIDFDAGGDELVEKEEPCIPVNNTLGAISVQTADLTIGMDDTVAEVNMTPVAADRSILWTTMRQTEKSPQYGHVECHLIGDDLVHCDRNNAGTDVVDGTGQINIHVQIATFEQDVFVQRGQGNIPSGPITIDEVDPSMSFTVIGGGTWMGGGFGSNEFVWSEVSSPTTLEIVNAQGGSGTVESWQVVEMAGAQVQTGAVIMAEDELVVEVILSEPIGFYNTFLLFGYTTPYSSADATQLFLLGEIVDQNTLRFSRRDSDVGLVKDIHYQLVSVPFYVQSGIAVYQPGQAALSIPIQAVNPQTSIAFSSCQVVLGQSIGSSDLVGDDTLTTDIPGTSASTFDLSNGITLELQRDHITSTAEIAWYVIDFSRPACSNY